MKPSLLAVALLSLASRNLTAADPPAERAFRAAAENGVRSEEVFRRTRHMMNAWLAYADERTLLLPDFIPGYKRGNREQGVYTPHNSGADNYPYLLATSWFTDRALFDGRMREMLRNEIRYTSAPDGVPGNLNLKTQVLGPAEPVRRRGIREGRPARHHGAARAHAVVRPDGRHDRGADGARGGPHAPTARCRTRAPSSTATSCRRSCGWRR